MSDSILTPEQVEWFAREIGLQQHHRYKELWVDPSEAEWLTGANAPFYFVMHQRDPRFLLPLETWLMRRGYRIWQRTAARVAERRAGLPLSERRRIGPNAAYMSQFS